MPAKITPVPEPTAQVNHVGDEGTVIASPQASSLPPKKQRKRRENLTAFGPPPSKKPRVSKTTKKPSSSTPKQPSKPKNAEKAPTTVLIPEVQGSLIGFVSCEERPKTAEGGETKSLPTVDAEAGAPVVSAGPSNLEVPKRRPGRPKKVVDPGALRSAGPSQRRSIKRSAKHVDNSAFQVQWKVVPPPKSSEDKVQDHPNVTVERSEDDAGVRPRVWASCKEDLLHVVPELSKTVNGLSWKSLETPMMLLEDQVSISWWPEPQHLMTSVGLSITQEYLYTAKPLPASPSHLRVVSVPELEDEPMTLIQDVNEGMDDLFSVPDLRGVDEPLVTAEEFAQSQDILDEELLLQYPTYSPPIQASGIPPTNANGTLSGVRVLVKNYVPSALPASPADPNTQMLVNVAAGDHQSSKILHQDIETLIDSSPNEITTPVMAITKCETPPTPSLIDSTPQAIVEGDANSQPTPAGLPQDVEALVDAYIRGVPIVLIAPREKLPIRLPQDYGWVILGFYQVTAVTEVYVPQEAPVKGPSATRFNWRFRLKWSSGGEYLLSDNIDAVSRPWWRKDPHPPQEGITSVSTEHYQKRRDEHTTTYPQFGDIGQNYNCLIPLHLLHMPGEVDDDANFPSGWFCSNYDSGTTTYDYSSVLAVPILIKHIFTHNRASLQQDATRVFRDIQTDVLLVQGSLGDPHFSYVIGADFLDLAVKTLCRSEASGTVMNEAERLSRLAEQRGDFKRSKFPLDATVIAWPTAGVAKKTHVLKARENAFCIQCLGSSTLISLRALPTPQAVDIKEIDSTSSRTRKVSKSRKGKGKQDDMAESSVQAAKSLQGGQEKSEDKSMSVSLVHGDILVICGHDVELKVKRNDPTTVSPLSPKSLTSTMPIQPGQFDDASLDATNRDGHTYIDQDDTDWPESSDEPLSDSDDDIPEDASIRVEDEDWENAERDFTKQYNRLRQHVAVRAGVAQSSQSSIDHSSKVAVLPAVNHPQSRKLAVSNTTALPHAPDKTADQLEALSKYASRISKIDTPYSQHMGVGVNRKGPSSYANMKDKADRATTEQVLDPRTRIILFKMIGRGVLQEINGCISTGKEANVYHALSPEAVHLAVKIFKTSILVFKDRDRYVAGEFRFRRGYNRHNPRKMVRLWAEKEMRNLKRLSMAGIRCPEPVEVRENVLVMRFLGDSEGWPSPRLKDAQLPEGALPELYQELVLTTRQLYHECKLVHADLSEYNILYHDSHLYIIDVSQSVEHDHPSAFDFLRSDITNIEEFFGRLGVTCLGLRRTFDFVTRERLSPVGDGEPVSDGEILTNWLRNPEPSEAISPHERVGEDGDGDIRQASLSKHEDSVFLHSYIPRSLNDVLDPERDIAAVSRGEAKQLIYANTLGIVNENVVDVVPGSHNSSVSQDDSSETEDEDSDEGDSDALIDGDQRRKPRGHRFEDKEAKKERKKTTKAEAREKRKNKTPKAEKKRLIKKTARA
ncbi:protein kinase rio1 [Pleurotus pulmonarius]|nr:protein kinase rio1 [Pleurotus pulmonarius]